MNIISNNCLGARLYEVQKLQFLNPFMWCRLYIDDFINLVNDYDNIDFSNVVFDIEFRLNHNCVKCTLDDKITVHFGHYVYDENQMTPIKSPNNTDIIYSNILEYARTKWFSRLNRTTEQPLFLYSFNNMQPNTVEYRKQLDKLLSITDKPLIIILHECVDVSSINIPKNIKILSLDDKTFSLTGTLLAKEIIQKLNI